MNNPPSPSHVHETKLIVADYLTATNRPVCLTSRRAVLLVEVLVLLFAEQDDEVGDSGGARGSVLLASSCKALSGGDVVS